MFQQNEFDVTRARKRFGLSQKEMALALNVSKQTIRIWEHDFEASQMSKKTLELIELLKLMDEYVVATEETIWLNIPLPIVQGRTPRQMILEGRMRDLIIEFLRLREGQSA
jgi:DNA-binding XRE family transcriptional regulator